MKGIKVFQNQDALDFIQYLAKHFPELFSKLPKPVTVHVDIYKLNIRNSTLTKEEKSEFDGLLEHWLYEKGFAKYEE